MSSAYANAGTFVRPYYMDPSCPDYLKPAQWTQAYPPMGSIFNGGYNYGPYPSIMPAPVPMPIGGCDPYACDDGKISFGTKVTSFVKGVFKPITNMFSSPGNFIKGALGIAAGAALIAVTGGAATPFLVAAGVVGGGIKIAQGAIGAASATTDAEAVAAWENMGEGTGVVAASVAGSKAALKKAGVDTTGMSYAKATKTCFTGAKGFAKTSWTNARTNIGSFFNKPAAPTTVTTQPQYVEQQALPAGKQPAGLLEAPKGNNNVQTATGNSNSTQALPAGEQPAGLLEAPKGNNATTANTQPKTVSIQKGKNCATPDNVHSPERGLYETADDIKLTPDEYATRGADQVAKFENRASQADLAYMEKRIASAKTPAARKALQQQYEIMKNRTDV